MTIETALKKSLLVIPSINGAKLLERMLPTLRIPGELVVVLDQGSADNTEEVCRSAGVGLRQLGRAHTYTEACNIGAEMAKERGCDFVFVANNDLTLTTDVIRELLAELLTDPDLAHRCAGADPHRQERHRKEAGLPGILGSRDVDFQARFRSAAGRYEASGG